MIGIHLFSVSPLSSSFDEVKRHFRNIIHCFPHLSEGEETLEHLHQPWKVT